MKIKLYGPRTLNGAVYVAGDNVEVSKEVGEDLVSRGLAAKAKESKAQKDES